MLQIYNSLTRNKEAFKPIVPGKVSLYACGITVYDRCHLGHARSMVGFDVIVRFLRNQAYEVTFVRNITDIDDKIIVRANERGISIDELTNHYIEMMDEDARALNLIKPDIEPRATTHIAHIVALIKRLIDKDVAYVSDSGDVCFEVDKFKEYGKLSNRDLDSLIAGSRVEIVREKRSPLDFVLWKRAKEGEPSWPSPWGEGRPGWHIECSAMAMHELGEHFDIHGGGLDLLFPHHENEIAQSEAASGTCFANYWMHVGMLQINGEKMAKSTGNFFTIEDVLKKHHPEVVRYFLLSSHYRSPLNYSEDNLANAHKALTRLYQALKEIDVLADEDQSVDEHWLNLFNQAMNDDFNTPVALSVLFQLSHELNKNRTPLLARTLKHLGGILGFLERAPEDFLQAGLDDNKDAIEALIAERLAARADKQWGRADEIRQELLAMGVELEDTAQGTTWRIRTE